MPFHIFLVDRAPWISSNDMLSVMLSLMDSILLKHCPAKKVMRGEANIFLRASADQRLKKIKKYDEKCSISNTHSRTVKY